MLDTLDIENVRMIIIAAACDDVLEPSGVLGLKGEFATTSPFGSRVVEP